MAKQGQDGVLWAFLALDVLQAEAEVRLPAPPSVPAFARMTVRPSKTVAS